MKITNRYFNPTSFAIFILIIWDALKAYLQLSAPLIQAAILIPVILLGVFHNLNNNLLKTVFSRPAIFWLLWIIYALINTFLITGRYYEDNLFVFVSSVVIAFLLFCFIIASTSNTADLINVLIFSYSVRLLLSFVFDIIGYGAYEDIARFGVEFNANVIAFGALFLILLTILRKAGFNSFRIIDYAMILTAVATIILTASRKNYISLIVIAFGYIYIFRSKDFIKNTVKVIAFILILVVFINWTLKNTEMGNRLINVYEKAVYAEQIEKMFDHRMGYYIYGWQIFKDNPINGIGLRNYPHVNRSPHVLHTEYMVQLTECGLIGAFLFVLFYGYIIKWLFLIRRKIIPYRKITETNLLFMLTMFILFLNTWIYNLPVMWVLIALSVRFIQETKSSIEYGQVEVSK